MSFVSALALAVAVLVVAPYLAHRLRRRRAEDRPFAAAHLVPPAPPRARRRSDLEDKALFGVRAASVVALALLGASPLVRCSRLALSRSSGASVALAIVLDDSMSMRAPSASGGTRFERAKKGARELLASAREGDAVAIVLAGAPPRVALAATTDLSSVDAALDGLGPSDRATDLDAALAIARALVAQMPQTDRRAVLLSDLADGKPEAAPLGEGSALPVWAPLTELQGAAADCGLTAASRTGLAVRVRVVCSHGHTPTGREVVLRAPPSDQVVVRGPAPAAISGEVTLSLASEPAGALVARLEGHDAIATDDALDVVLEAGPAALAVVGDGTGRAAATGGAPVLEQALASLKLDVVLRPVPVVPERLEDLTPFVGVVLDDPPGLTPEQRRAVSSYLDEGGVVLLSLGPRAGAAPLGASFEPVLTRAVTWESTNVPGADPGSGKGALVEAAGSLVDLGARSRAVLATEDRATFAPMMLWKDGAPLIARRASGRGEVWLVTLPFDVETSDLPLRPGFLALLDAWVDKARIGAAPARAEVGGAWQIPAGRTVAVQGPAGPVEPENAANGEQGLRFVPALIGAYKVSHTGGKVETRFVVPSEAEIDLRPRRLSPGASSQGLGETRATMDVSWVIALSLLALMLLELVLRLRARAAAAAEA